MWVESRIVCCLPEILDQLAHLADLVRIEADRRFVENQQIRFVHKRVGQSNPLPIILSKARRSVCSQLLSARKVLSRRRPVRDPAMRNAFERGAIIEIFGHAHVVIERNVFRHVTKMRAGLERLLENIETGDRGAAGSWRHEARQRMRIVVVLPAPFGPRKPMISPLPTSKFRSWIAVWPAYRLVRFSTLIMKQTPPEEVLVPSVKRDQTFFLLVGES